MLKKITNYFKEWYYNFIFTDDYFIPSQPDIFNPNFYTNVDSHHIEQQDVERKYQEGLMAIKKQVKAQAEKLGEINKENLEKVLKNYSSNTDNWREDLDIPDLIDLSVEKDNIVKKILYEQKVYKEKDIKNEKDKVTMIKTRINHYKELQNKRLIRRFNRELRLAEKTGDQEKIERLRRKINGVTRSSR